MDKKQLFDEIMKLDHKERVSLAGAVIAEFTAEEIAELAEKKAPQWSSSNLGKAVIGTIAAIAGIVAGYFINKQDTPQIPEQDAPVEVQPAIIQ